MTLELALIPQYLIQRGNKTLENVLSVMCGVAGLSLLSQIAIPLAWTPVPITGQTFGVYLVALLWGRKRGLAVILSYLAIGAVGLPVFALGKYGLSFGPTSGYLVGMVLATYWIGMLSDLGWTKTYLRTYLAAAAGSLVIFACGNIVLSFFIPLKALLAAGVLPFLPGDVIKTSLASYIAYKFQKSLSARK